MIEPSLRPAPTVSTILARCLGRRSVALVADAEGALWIEKRPVPTGSEDAQRREFGWTSLAAASGVPVAEAKVESAADGTDVLRTRWMGDRTFERATELEWSALGQSLSLLQFALASCSTLAPRRPLILPSDPIFEIARALWEEIHPLIERQFHLDCASHGDFQIGNVIRVKPSKCSSSHCIIDFEDCCLDYAGADLGCMVWSMWAHGEEWKAVEAFVAGYQETTRLEIPPSYIGVFAVLQHLRWIDFLTVWQASAAVVDKAIRALVELRQVAPTWSFAK